MKKKVYTKLDILYDDALNNYEYKKQYEKAVEIYFELIKNDYTSAYYRLGICYYRGRGVEQNYAKAAEFFQVAAERDVGFAQLDLGEMYANGKGVEKSYQMAMKWYQRAADNNMSNAQKNLDICYDLFMNSDKGDCICKICDKKMPKAEARAHINKYSFLCADCYKDYLNQNCSKVPAVRKKIKIHYITMLISMLIGFAVGLTLYFAIGLNVAGYSPFKLPVLIFSTLAFPSIGLFLRMLFSVEETSFDLDILFNPLGLILAVIFVLSFVGSPFITIYKLINNGLNLSRSSKMIKLNKEILADLENQGANAAQIIYSDPNDECIRLNARFLDMVKYYR